MWLKGWRRLWTVWAIVSLPLVVVGLGRLEELFSREWKVVSGESGPRRRCLVEQRAGTPWRG
jgi:hypothetical protein